MIYNKCYICLNKGTYICSNNDNKVISVCGDCMNVKFPQEELSSCYYCELCNKKAHELQGSWNKDPYKFFCSTECHEKFLSGKPHRKIPDIVRQLCWLFDGWIVGGAVDFITGKSTECNDIDIVIPITNWTKASKLIPAGSKANSFGGFKFESEGFSIDVWADDIGIVLVESHKPVKAYHLKSRKTLGLV